MEIHETLHVKLECSLQTNCLSSGKNVCKGPAACGACVFSHFSHVQVFVSLWTVAHQAPLSKDFAAKNTGMGHHALLQGIFLTQGLNLGFLHCRQILYCWATTQARQPMVAQAIWETCVVVGWEGGRLCSSLPNQYEAAFYFSLMEPTAENSQPVFNSGSKCLSTTVYFCLIRMYFLPYTYTHAISFHYCKMTTAVDLNDFSSVGWKKINWVPYLLSDKWQLLTGCYLEILFLNIHK